MSIVRFEQVPSRAQDLDQLVRWQVRKSAPFAIEEAQVSYVPGLHAEDGHEFIVTLAKRGVIQEYEQLCADAGAHAGLVDLATLNVINAVLAGRGAPSGDWLLVNIAADYTSIALLRGPHLIFFRNRAADTDGTLADLVHQSAMYYEDRLKGAGFSRVILCGAAAAGAHQTGDIDQLRRSLEDRLRTPVESVDPRTAAALTDRITAGAGTARRPDAAGGPAAAGSRGGTGVIRTNLSSRPFYNERLVYMWLAALAAVVVVATAFNVVARPALLAQRHPAGDAGVARRSRAPPICAGRRHSCAPASIRGRSISPRPMPGRPTT